ncbi:hypothetical protein IPM19_04215 [bacterium]|nr:MAG: hypothetical protein IPM19_04215 [bacterium]
MNTPNMNSIMRSKQAQNPLFQSILIIIVLVIFAWFILIPKFNSYVEKSNQLKSAEGQLDQIQADEMEMNELISKLETSENQIKLVDEALPLATRATQLSILFESYATSSGMQVSQINISDEAVGKTPAAGNKTVLEDPYGAKRALKTVNVNITVSGNIDQFRNFLQIVESSGRIVDVSNMDVTSGDGVTRFTVKLKTYVYEAV